MSEKKSASELKPCPFCGGEARAKTTNNAIFYSGLNTNGWYVYCAVCGYRTPTYKAREFMSENGTKWFLSGYNDAIDAWNRRTIE